MDAARRNQNRQRHSQPVKLRLLPLLFFVLSHFSFAILGRSDAAEARPNILFITADDASLHFGAAYDCNWVRTPHIDRLAHRGLVFLNAYTPTAKCAPSRAAILTGRNPWQLEAAANHQSIFPTHFKAFTEVLREAGFHVGGQGKRWGPGEAKTAAGEPRDWGMLNRNFKEFLALKPRETPFFFWFGSTFPHRPYKPDSGLAAGKRPSDIPQVPAIWPDNDIVRRDLLDYAVAIESFDAQVGEQLRVLEASGFATNTLVIVTSDNGMPFPRAKGHDYELANHIPFVACWPAGIARPGRKVSEFVSFIDLAPTFLELSGCDGQKNGMATLTGRSLTDLLADRPIRARPCVVLGRERNDLNARPGTEFGLGYPIRALRAENWLFLHNFEPDRWPCGDPELGLKDTDKSPTKQLIETLGRTNALWQAAFGKRPADEMYDLATDPDCLNNLAARQDYSRKVEELRTQLLSELKRQDDPRVLGHGDQFDRYPGKSDRNQSNPKTK